MSIRFGVSPIAWANDDMPELGGDTPLEAILADVRDLGFAGVELGGKFPRDPAVLQPIMGRFGLDIVGGWYSAELLTRTAAEEIAALQDHLALLKAMGSTVFVQAETSNAIHGDRGRPLSATPRLSNRNALFSSCLWTFDRNAGSVTDPSGCCISDASTATSPSRSSSITESYWSGAGAGS